jgi:hypothetical protein
MGICEVLIPLTNSPSSEVQGNSAAALGNLSSKGMLLQDYGEVIHNFLFLQTAEQLPTTIPLSMMCGTSRTVECISICSAS